jgi:hypothetical protein
MKYATNQNFGFVKRFTLLMCAYSAKSGFTHTHTHIYVYEWISGGVTFIFSWQQSITVIIAQFGTKQQRCISFSQNFINYV